ncbi:MULTISPECIES: metal ABC transporter permease [unclassified Actinobaculum]|uniref:metal ABC transporter permease n=1 Tax=unclassified Actinobaculum TaxID=2609299 RepID=UPI000D527AD0|nr:MULTISPECIES: metal ABC transporter permease [unclassified Actinobaculum]AWE42583.1 ABC transporter [Actinobaculum sp. 313]RTE48126.1 metal ABC transporter permease [Actinobaculum sp. 352]
MIELLSSDLMQRALVVAFLVGLSAPVVGTYLVQRGMALMGDGIGHVSLTGVALGWLVAGALGLSPNDILAIPGAILASLVGAILIEVVRSTGRTGGDVALAMLFYGGIAGGVLLIRIAGGTTTNLNSYLFGSLAVVSTADVRYTVALAIVIMTIGIGLREALFALSHDEEFARASGLPVQTLNVLVAVVAALTVSVSMRVVGVLLVSAIMIVPVAIAQLVSSSFARTMHIAMGIGVTACISGLVITYYVPASPGATIVVMLITVYAIVALVRATMSATARRRSRHQQVEAIS